MRNNQLRIMHCKRARAAALILFVIGYSAFVRSPAKAQPIPDADEDASESRLESTEIGIRFTPRMAAAISKRMVERMTPRYELDDRQAEEISEVMQRQFMEFARENAALGRDMIELMTATMIENDGRFPKEEATAFAAMANKFTPRFKEFVTQSSTLIGAKMTVRQKLKYTGDVSLFAAGLITFENRMKRWEQGRVGDFANPFFDPADKDPAKAEPEPVNPHEHAEHRKARKQVETWIGWQIDKEGRWPEYLERAARYYGFTEAQNTAAQAILKDCQERVKSIKTREWTDAVKENRVLRELSQRADDEIARGPWMVGLEDAFQKLLKPLNDLDAEFKRRIDDLPDSTQRANAREAVRKALAGKGVTQLPS